MALARINAGNGVAVIRDNDKVNSATLASVITNTYNTGHLLGDIRRCYLSDNTVGSVVSGPELVSDPSFDNPSAWVAGTNISVSGGNAIYNSATHGTNLDGPTSAIAKGKTYLVSITVSSYTSGKITIYMGGAGGAKIGTGVGVFSTAITATTNTSGINLQADSICAMTLSDVSIKEVVSDRSYKAQAANITGTLTKSTVATNAQLVAYSGFSAANYLQEPYSADLDFGTGEWSAGAWVNVPTSLPVESFPVVGPELVTNGDFSNGTTGWLNSNATLSVSSGVLTVTAGPSSTYGYAWQEISTVAGKTYSVSIDMPFADNSLIRVGSSIGSGDLYQLFTSTAGTKKFVFTAVGSLSHLRVGDGSAAAVAVSRFDNISVREVAPALIADRSHSTGTKINLGMNTFGNLTATAYDGTTPRTVTTTAAYNTATWLKAEAVYKTDGSLAILVNGQEVAVTRGNPLLTLNNSNAVLTIGNSYALDAPFPGSIALLKLSATAPTYDQAQWMYEQEKQLFRDGAQCCLPDSGNIVDLTYDDVTDKWVAVSATNESSWTGLVRTNVTAVPAGSNSKVVATSGVKLNARTTTNPGVDVTIPAYLLREELLKDGEDSGKLSRIQVPLDYVGGFTATTVTGNTAITSVAGLSYPSQTTIIGARVSGTGIPANTTIVGISGTTIYLSAAATASASAVQISFVDFVLPIGMEAKEVISAGAIKTEGATKDFTRLYDGFRETIRFGTAPGYTAAVQIIAIRSQS